MIRKVMIYAMGPRGLLVFREPDFPDVPLQVPGGTVEDGETFEAGACREFAEETGLVLEILIGIRVTVGTAGDTVQAVIIDAHRLEADLDLLVRLDDEALESCLVDLDVTPPDLVHDEPGMFEVVHHFQVLIDGVDLVLERLLVRVLMPAYQSSMFNLQFWNSSIVWMRVSAAAAWIALTVSSVRFA